MHDDDFITYILPKQAGYFVTTTLENREFGHNARSATSRFSLACSSLDLSKFLSFCIQMGHSTIFIRKYTR
jgi:hypothetical protein